MKERDILLGGAMLLLFILYSCQSNDGLQNQESDMIKSSKDPHSYAVPSEAIVTHLDLKLNVNFNTKNIEGEADVFFKQEAPAQKLILDIKGLNIHSVTYANGNKADYIVSLRKRISRFCNIIILIFYCTLNFLISDGFRTNF